MIIKVIRCLLLAFLISFFHLPTNCQTRANSKDALPLDPNVLYGKLENGFTYYIRKNTNPPGKVWMYLVVKAGSYHEEKDQAGLAHFLEHMPFRGTMNFPDPWSYFETKGLQRGDALNAHTSSDNTYYTFQNIPSSVELINDGLNFLYDCAGRIKLDSNDIDSERVVLISELEPSISLIHEKFWSTVAGRPQYLLLSNQVRNIREFEHKSLIRFYEKWYRPDLQAVIVVGDIDPLSVEKQVKALFSGLKEKKEPVEFIRYPFTVESKNQYISITDEKQSDVEVKMYMKRLYKPLSTPDEILASLKYTLCNEMFKNRLQKIKEHNKPLFKNMSCSYEPIFGRQDRGSLFGAFLTEIQVGQDQINEGINSAIVELERLRRFGFTTDEFGEAKKQLTERLRKDRNYSEAITNAYLEDFLQNNLSQRPIHREKLVMESLDRLTILGVNNIVKDLITDTNMDIVVIGPEKDKGALPNETILREWLNKARETKMEPYHETAKVVLEKPMISNKKLATLSTVVVKGKTTLKEIDVTKLNLSNGVNILLKPISSGSSSRKISLMGISPGGASSYSNENDYETARNVDDIVTQCGFGQYNKEELELFKSKKAIECGIFVSERTEGISASCEIPGLETMLQTVYQYFTSPRYDKECMQNWLVTKDSLSPGSSNSSSIQFYDTINKIVNEYFTRPEFSRHRNLKRIDIKKVKEIYESRFGNARDFLFVISGDFITEDIVPVLAKYLGNLPSKDLVEKYHYNTVYDGPRGPVNKKLYLGTDQRAQINKHYTGRYMFDPVENMKLKVLKNIIGQIMYQRLRVKEGGTYSVGAFLKNQKEESGVYDISISFECAQNDMKRLTEAFEQEIEILKKHGPESSSLQRAIAQERQNVEGSFSNPDFWCDYLSKQGLLGEDILEIVKWKKILDSITSDDIKKIANEFLVDERLLSFIQLPENIFPVPSTKKEIPESISWDLAGSMVNVQSPSWDSLSLDLTRRYGPNLADSIMMITRVNFFGQKRLYPEYTDALIAFTKKHNNDRTPNELNTDAWRVFKFSANMKQLEIALDWVSLALAGVKEDPFYMDTYANILYKMGRPEEAIEIEQRAFFYARRILLIDAEAAQSLMNTMAVTLFKMEKREPTWYVSPENPFQTPFPTGLMKYNDSYYWKKVGEDIKGLYTGNPDSLIIAAKIRYYKKSEAWPQYTESLITYLTKHFDVDSMDPGTLNNNAWEIFMYSTERKELNRALAWSQKTLEYSSYQNYYTFLDTYANILYKMGKQEEAMVWQVKAIALCPRDQKADLENTLKKMKNKENTWIVPRQK